MIPRLKTLATDTAIPLKLVEAMQVGKAIVASKVDGLTELLDDSNSVLYEANSVAEFTNAVQKLINDEKLRLTLGESAKDTIRNSLRSWEDSINIVYRLYTVLMRDKK
jgi:glycosyltransferase involved in cell wall biosynthesis